MNIPIHCARIWPGRSHLLAILLSCVLIEALPSVAIAQGRCSCNGGCHRYPGQCVQSGSSGCESGFAPYCGTRATSCPNAGWVSCSGTCTCVRIAPLDAGTPDAGAADVSMPTDSMPTDVSVDRVEPLDTSVATDVPMSIDVGTPSDGTTSMDVRAVTDVPASLDARPATDSSAAGDLAERDALAVDRSAPGADVSDDAAVAGDTPGVPSDRGVRPPDSAFTTLDGGGSVPDASTALDAPGAPSDAASAGDGGCVCAGGVCVANVCYRERCTFHPELGFICTTPGSACRLIGPDPICVPPCAGVVCAQGEFCDQRSNGDCVVDRCTAIVCPTGTTCVRNQCGRWSGADGGKFAPDDGGSGDDSGVTAIPTAMDDGCGCRVGGGADHGRRWGLSAALLALMGISARRRRGSRSAR